MSEHTREGVQGARVDAEQVPGRLPTAEVAIRSGVRPRLEEAMRHLGEEVAYMTDSDLLAALVAQRDALQRQARVQQPVPPDLDAELWHMRMDLVRYLYAELDRVQGQRREWERRAGIAEAALWYDGWLQLEASAGGSSRWVRADEVEDIRPHEHGAVVQLRDGTGVRVRTTAREVREQLEGARKRGAAQRYPAPRTPGAP